MVPILQSSSPQFASAMASSQSSQNNVCAGSLWRKKRFDQNQSRFSCSQRTPLLVSFATLKVGSVQVHGISFHKQNTTQWRWCIDFRVYPRSSDFMDTTVANIREDSKDNVERHWKTGHSNAFLSYLSKCFQSNVRQVWTFFRNRRPAGRKFLSLVCLRVVQKFQKPRGTQQERYFFEQCSDVCLQGP